MAIWLCSFSEIFFILSLDDVQALCIVLPIYVTDGMFCMNGTTSVPKSVLRYTLGNELSQFYTTKTGNVVRRFQRPPRDGIVHNGMEL